MFLVGGPAYSGTTLLTLLLNQADIVCLDEPDFHKVAQSHRSIPYLERLFPGVCFPPRQTRQLSLEEAMEVMAECEAAIAPRELGMKTCGSEFLKFAELYKGAGRPVVAIFRDIRDTLVRPLPPWLDESKLNREYRMVWERRDTFDLWFPYEELVADPAGVMARISPVLGRKLSVKEHWLPSDVHRPMLKSERHEMLTSGSISASRVGIWREAGLTYLAETLETAQLMGYDCQ
jgi:hypothetical protein